VETAECIITGIELNDWTAISVSDAGFSFTTTASRSAVGPIRMGRKEKEEETKNDVISIIIIILRHTKNLLFG